MKITTNNIPRLLKYGYEMPEKYRSDFDYIESEEFDSHSFFEYKGQWYDFNELINTIGYGYLKNLGWNGYSSDSFFSGIVVKLCSDDNDRIIVGRYSC